MSQHTWACRRPSALPWQCQSRRRFLICPRDEWKQYSVYPANINRRFQLDCIIDKLHDMLGATWSASKNKWKSCCWHNWTDIGISISYCRISEASSSFFSPFRLSLYIRSRFICCVWYTPNQIFSHSIDSIYRVWAVFRAIDSHHKKVQSCIVWPFPLPVLALYTAWVRGCWPARNSRRGQTTTACKCSPVF
jgi:hypothetical protein